MDPLKESIRSEALRLGFTRLGSAECRPVDEMRPFYEAFIASEGHAGMHYLATHLEKRLNPALLLPEARSVIAVLFNYFPAQVIPEEDNYIISKYAYGKDYHLVIKERLKLLAGFLKERCGAKAVRSFVDSGTVMEKFWAQQCGVGWQGKNTLIINPEGGSFYFIGILLTDLMLEPDTPSADRCGSCRRCAEACPTGALHDPYRLDIRRCIAYQTIETDEPIPENIRANLHGRIYGCDICQDVCPYNRKAVPHGIPEFMPSDSLQRMGKSDWDSLTQKGFDALFSESSVKRTGLERLRRSFTP